MESLFLNRDQALSLWSRSIDSKTLDYKITNSAAAAKLLQSCPTLRDPTDGSPPGSPIPGIPQARTLEWVAISLFYAWKWKVKGKSLSHVRLLATPWTAAYQAPPFIGFARQEYWSGVPSPSPNHLSSALQILPIHFPTNPLRFGAIIPLPPTTQFTDVVTEAPRS